MKKEDWEKQLDDGFKSIAEKTKLSEKKLIKEIYWDIQKLKSEAKEQERITYLTLVLVSISFGILIYNFPPSWWF